MREQKQQLRKAKRIERSGQKSYSSDAQGDALHGQQQLQYGEQRQTATNSSINDGETTNLYVTNIHTDVDEQALCMAFAKYGPIASVKIMWPRTPEEFARQRNSGFVSFMDRKTAASALSGMDGHLLNDLALRVCWGKRISIPPKPVFVLDSSNPGRLPPTGHPFNAKRPTNGSNEDNIPEVHVERPLDHRLVRLIHWTIEHVIKNGPEFECLLIYRKADDPRFSFLTDYESPEHVYYRWRMYSLLNGDTKLKWRDLMFFMYDEGPVWVPPKPETFGANNAGDGLLDNTGMNNVSSSEAEEEAERNHGAVQPDKLGTRARDRLERRVRRVRNAKRGTIAEAMTFAIDHAYAATDVVDVICRALLDPETPFSEKLFKLMLISDILHNCSAPVANAWRLRQTFEERLDQIFKHLATVFRAIDARLKAEHFRKVVLSVLAVWEAWMMFPEKNIHKLAAYFL
ncbi:hypothetical protein BX070DRAFT_145483 [Coemansia spiralis]|nr:hypothetical protein BX070DRAFT_145483 [Coemansia spiralis]